MVLQYFFCWQLTCFSIAMSTSMNTVSWSMSITWNFFLLHYLKYVWKLLLGIKQHGLLKQCRFLKFEPTQSLTSFFFGLENKEVDTWGVQIWSSAMRDHMCKYQLCIQMMLKEAFLQCNCSILVMLNCGWAAKIWLDWKYVSSKVFVRSEGCCC